MRRQRPASNVSFVFLSEVAARAVSAIALFLAARALGPYGTGVYSIGTTLLFLGSRFALWGLDQILIRDVACDHGRASKYFSNFILLRVLLSSFMVIIFALLLRSVLPYAPESRWPLFILVCGLVPENIWDICRSVFIALEKMQYVFLISCVTALARVGGILLAVWSGSGIAGFAWAVSGGGLLGAICGIICVWRCLSLHWQYPDLVFCKSEFAEGIPFWAINLSNVLDAQVDTVLLSWLVSESELGLYAAGLGVLLAFGVLPTTFRLAFFPSIVQLFVANRAKLELWYQSMLKYLVVLALPVSAGLFLVADQIIQLIYREAFAESASVLRILCWSLLLLLPGDINSRLLLASRNQRRSATYTMLGLILNVTLALLLVPHIGILGAAWARLASNMVVTVLNHLFVQKYLAHANLAALIWRPLLAVTIMAFIVACARGLPLPIVIAVGSLVYGVLILMLRIVSVSEIIGWLGFKVAH